MLKKLIALPLFCAVLAACGSNTNSPQPSTDPSQNESGDTQGSLSAIIVTDTSGSPVAGASVMIGTAPNQPFANNVVTTDKSGSFKPMRDWNVALPVTISAQGFVRTTYMSQLPLQKYFVVRAKAPAVKPELNGITTGFGTLVKDGFVDVGIVIPALTRADLANFQASTLLSPENDVIKAAGQTAYLPSNITLPEQSESMIITVKLNKPTYRMYFDRRANYKMVSAHVKFPFKKVIQESQSGNAGIELVNYFTFLEAGITNTVVATDKQTVNLPVNQLKFDSSVTALAPVVTKTQSVLAVALVKDGTQLYPTDIKNLASKESRKLSFPMNSSGHLLGVLSEAPKKRTGAATDFMSVNLKDASNVDAFDFLPLVAAPKFIKGALILRPPTVPSTLNGVATTATLSTVEVKTVGKNSYEVKTPEWDVYAPTWATEIVLPTLPTTLETLAPQKRWETVFMGAPLTSAPTALGPELMNSVTHLTRSAVDL